jgi:DNA polymerase III gamma/tau subunit
MVSKYRVVVLDEAHGLTGPSLQALLKTLEEPPEHMVILLVTTNPEKLPATIVSRCSQLKLKPVSVEDCTKLLVRIAKDKDLYASGITEQHLERIARSTEAHPRNALHALDQVYTMVLGSQDGSQALDSGQIDQYVKDVSQASAQSVAASIVRSMLDGQVGASLKRAEDNRPDSAQIIEHISSYCRQALVFVTAPKVFDPYYSEVFQGIELLQNKQSSQVLLEVYEVFVNLLAQTASYAVPADQVIDFGIAKGALLCKTFKKAQTETQSPPRPEPQPKTEIPVTETKVLRQPAKPEGDFAGLTERKVHTQAQG